MQLKKKYGNRKNLIEVRGDDNHIESLGMMKGSKIRVVGSGNIIRVCHGCKINASTFVIIGNNCSIIISDNTSFGSGCWTTVMGNHNEIFIGKDAMVADEVDMWASDSHAIFQENQPNQIINPSGNIYIENHVWIGKRAIVLKNVKIGKNTIIGMGSIVTKSIPEGSIAVGNPARVVKDSVSWTREHINI